MSDQAWTRRTIHKGRRFDFAVLARVAEDGRVQEREVVIHPGAAVILPVLEQPRSKPMIILIRNDRPAVGATLWELPAGTLEPGEAPEACAARELAEESGYAAATLVPLGRFYTTPGLTDEVMHAFLARGLTRVGQRLDTDESLTVHAVTPADAWSMMERGELADGKSMLTLHLARARRLI